METTTAIDPQATIFVQTMAKDVKVGDHMPTSMYVAHAVTAVRADGDKVFISYDVKAPVKIVDGEMVFKLKTLTVICSPTDIRPTVKS